MEFGKLFKILLLKFTVYSKEHLESQSNIALFMLQTATPLIILATKRLILLVRFKLKNMQSIATLAILAPNKQ